MNLRDSWGRISDILKLAADNGWLEYDPFSLGWPIFCRELLVLGSATCARTLSSNRMEEC